MGTSKLCVARFETVCKEKVRIRSWRGRDGWRRCRCIGDCRTRSRRWSRGPRRSARRSSRRRASRCGSRGSAIGIGIVVEQIAIVVDTDHRTGEVFRIARRGIAGIVGLAGVIRIGREIVRRKGVFRRGRWVVVVAVHTGETVRVGADTGIGVVRPQARAPPVVVGRAGSWIDAVTSHARYGFESVATVGLGDQDREFIVTDVANIAVTAEHRRPMDIVEIPPVLTVHPRDVVVASEVAVALAAVCGIVVDAVSVVGPDSGDPEPSNANDHHGRAAKGCHVHGHLDFKESIRLTDVDILVRHYPTGQSKTVTTVM